MASTSKKNSKKRNHVGVSMEVVTAEEGKQLPMLAYFPTPFDPQEGADGVELYRNTDKYKSAQQQLVVRTSGNVDYVGGNVLSETVSWQPTIFAMGVFDKEEGSLKVVPVLGNKVLRMEPKVRGVSYHIEQEEATELDDEMRLEKRKALVNRFGTKKAKTTMQKMGRAVVKETVLGGSTEEFKNALDEAANTEGLVQTRQSVIEAANKALVRKIPPYNLEATTPEDAYPLDRIISSQEWDSLEVDTLMKAARKGDVLDKLRASKSYPKFVLDRVHRLKVEGDREGSARRARILVYLSHLLTLFHATIGRKFPGRDPDFNEAAAMSIPEAVYQKFESLFIVEKPKEAGRRNNKTLLRDYVLSYILVLALKVDGFQVDPLEIATELQMTITSLEPHYQQLGCKIDSDRFGKGNKSRISLSVPLKLIDLTEKKKGRGRK